MGSTECVEQHSDKLRNSVAYFNIDIGVSGAASRAEINEFLLPKLSEALTDKQKLHKINYLLTKWRQKELIENQGADRFPRWVLAEKISEKK